jgi:chromosome segregation ATPase
VAAARTPAASVAAAQAVLDSVERRESALRTALRTYKKDLRRLKKKAKRHRSTLNGLKADLKKIKSSRVAIVEKS